MPYICDIDSNTLFSVYDTKSRALWASFATTEAYLKDIDGYDEVWDFVIHNDRLLADAIPKTLRDAPPERPLLTTRPGAIGDFETYSFNKWKVDLFALFAYVAGTQHECCKCCKWQSEGDDEISEDGEAKTPVVGGNCLCHKVFPGGIVAPEALKIEEAAKPKPTSQSIACTNCTYDGDAARCAFYRRQVWKEKKAAEEGDSDDEDDDDGNDDGEEDGDDDSDGDGDGGQAIGAKAAGGKAAGITAGKASGSKKLAGAEQKREPSETPAWV